MMISTHNLILIEGGRYSDIKKALQNWIGYYAYSSEETAQRFGFVKTYPYRYSTNDDGKIHIDKEKHGHEVVYQGSFNEETGKWSGTWDIFVSERRDPKRRGHFISTSIFGAWQMSMKRTD